MEVEENGVVNRLQLRIGESGACCRPGQLFLYRAEVLSGLNALDRINAQTRAFDERL
jgi:hypothetical protein